MLPLASRSPRLAASYRRDGKMPWHVPPRAIRSQIELAYAGMLMPKLQTQVSLRLT